jgi:hypothetical protein
MSGLTGRAVKGKRKGKGRADAPEPSEDASTVQPAQSEATAIPDKIYVRQPPTPRSEPTPATAPTALAFLPAAITRPLEALWRSGWFARILLPMPLLLVLARRRQRLNRTETVTVRERLRRARVQGLWPWIQWWLQWWADKVAGVWKLGTTITYM